MALCVLLTDAARPEVASDTTALTHTDAAPYHGWQAPKPAMAEVVEHVQTVAGEVISRLADWLAVDAALPAASVGVVSEYAVPAESAESDQTSMQEAAPAAAVSQVLFAAS
jgi:hypothetical protein